MAALRKHCKDVEFVFIDAPHILQPVDLDFGGQYASAFETEAVQSTDPALAPRGWWRANADKTGLTGLEESFAVVKETLQGSRFDGVFGFSQGAAFASLLSALLERPHVYPPFLVDGQSPHPPFRFCIAGAGFKPADAICDAAFGESYSTPTLHIIGKTDIIVTEERAQKLLNVTANKRVEFHVGGHFVPSKIQWRKFLHAVMVQGPLDPDIPSPSSSESGTSTPVTTD